MRTMQKSAGKLAAAILVLSCWQGLIPLQAQISGGMLSPDIDAPGEPFSYFWHPTDVIGALYAPVATEVTPEGYLYTGFGELMFLVGNPPQPVEQRVKTLYQGYLPVVRYQLMRTGVKYTFEMFAADLGGGLQGLPVNFVRVRLTNEAGQQRASFLSAAYRFLPPINELSGRPEYRFNQRFDLIPKTYVEGQSEFNPAWAYSFADDALIRNDRVVYLFPNTPQPDQVSLSLGDRGFAITRDFTGEIAGNFHPAYDLNPHTLMGVVTYRIVLKPGQSQELIFKMPIVPLPAGSAEARQVKDAEYSENFRRTVRLWDELVGKNPPLQYPEVKVQQALLANAVFSLLAIDRVGPSYIMNDNKFQYHQSYGGINTVPMIVALDFLGLHDIARRTLLHYYSAQAPNGSFKVSYLPESYAYENFGNVIWGWNWHYRLTGDSSFLQEVYPGLLRALDWEQKTAQEDPLGLMPTGKLGYFDDAGLSNAHQTGQNIWVLIGLRNAIGMAEARGNKTDVERFGAEYQRFWNAFVRQLSVQTSQTAGYIPPALDRTLLGNNWDNMLTLYPEQLFQPFDPRVTATIRESRKTYSEGILGYVWPRAVAKKGDDYTFDTTKRLHYWHSLDNAENALVRGDAEDQEFAVKDLYAFLLHTTSTHAPQEWGTQPWSTRDYCGSGNILPNGPGSGFLIELLRNMLVREQENDLVLFSALSPAWLQPGKSIKVLDAPTIFGELTAVLEATSAGFEVNLSNRFWREPEHIALRIPWFYDVQSAEADGRPIKVERGQIFVSAHTRRLRVAGRIRPGTLPMSYERAVEDYKREYKKHYDEFLRTGITRQ